MGILSPTDIVLLSEQACDAIRTDVHALRDHWVERNAWVPFYTLGAASYLDAGQNGSPSYYEKAQQCNPVLRAHFGWLYTQMADALEKELSAPVCYRETCGLPGFHVFLSSQMFERPVASIHQDLQYQTQDWDEFKSVDFNRPISFTLAVALPKYGGGLSVWDVWHEEMVGRSPEEIKALIKSRERKHHAYRVGHMVLHSGHMVHQIAPMVNAQPDDERITLQGHGLLCDGTWRVYW